MSALTTKSIRIPSANTLLNASKFAIKEDKPIMMDYWCPSLENKCFLGVSKESGNLLVKDESEYTSVIKNMYKLPCDNGVEDILIATENSIYLVPDTIKSKEIAE